MAVPIWAVPAYLPSLQPPLTPQRVAQAETELGVKLPEAYLRLLGEQNGGYVRHVFADTPHGMIWGIGPHFPSITESVWQADTDDEGSHWIPRQPDLLVPFDGDGHWYLCFDYRDRGAQAEPAIVYVDLDGEEESRVAGNFAAFLAALTPKADSATFGLASDLPLQSVVDAMDRALGVAFDEVDTELYGYPVYRWPLGAAGNREWLWLSPNRVPRGFVRPSDPRYAELVDLLPGTALRLPEQADVVYILECTKGVMTRVGDACARAGMAARRLASSER